MPRGLRSPAHPFVILRESPPFNGSFGTRRLSLRRRLSAAGVVGFLPGRPLDRRSLRPPKGQEAWETLVRTDEPDSSYTTSSCLSKGLFDVSEARVISGTEHGTFDESSYLVNTQSLLELSDVADKPCVKIELPAPLRIGDRLQLRFTLRRQKGGRSEVLDVSGEVKIDRLDFDVSSGVSVQRLSVLATGLAPTWRAVKKTREQRVLSPARFPRTAIA